MTTQPTPAPAPRPIDYYSSGSATQPCVLVPAPAPAPALRPIDYFWLILMFVFLAWVLSGQSITRQGITYTSKDPQIVSMVIIKPDTLVYTYQTFEGYEPYHNGILRAVIETTTVRYLLTPLDTVRNRK